MTVPGGGLPTIILLVDGAILLGLGIRDSLTGSWPGAVLAGSLGLLFVVSPWVFESRRRVTPGR